MSKAVACVILPTYNEAENIRDVVTAIFEQATKVQSHDLLVLVVDDSSPDGTADIVQELKMKFSNLHLITGKKDGLGEAYKRGMKHAREELNAELVFEMDADGQHDPSLIPLFVTIADYGFGLVIGSRFAPGGSTPDFSFRRKMISLVGNWMIRVLGGIPRIHDCTSGYRCIRVEYLEKCNLNFLSTRGYSFQSSLLCELLRAGAKVIEVPIVFPDRKHGSSKLSMQDQIEFLINIAKIRFRQSEEFVKYAIVGVVGLAVNLGFYVILTRIFNMELGLASPIAIELSIISNFILNQGWTFKKRNAESTLISKFFKFHMAAGIAGILNYFVFMTLVFGFNLFDILANMIGIAVATILNYILNSLWTWREMKEEQG